MMDRKIRRNDKFVGFLGCEFSNFYKCQFTINGVTFNCVEQAFMYCKAKLFGDHEIAEEILKSVNPAQCKKLGRKVKGFNDKIWGIGKDVDAFFENDCKGINKNNNKLGNALMKVREQLK